MQRAGAQKSSGVQAGPLPMLEGPARDTQLTGVDLEAARRGDAGLQAPGRLQEQHDRLAPEDLGDVANGDLQSGRCGR
jgi:hypothetical protein